MLWQPKDNKWGYNVHIIYNTLPKKSEDLKWYCSRDQNEPMYILSVHTNTMRRRDASASAN